MIPIVEEWDIRLGNLLFQQGVQMPMDMAEARAMRYMPDLWYAWRHDDSNGPRDCSQYWAEVYQ